MHRYRTHTCAALRETDIGHYVGEKVQPIAGIVDTRTVITFKAF